MEENKCRICGNNPLVSVSLGTYNGEKYLAEQMDSILQQTYPNIEIVVTDDCSTDNTPQILKNYAEKYDNIKVYFNEINIGLIGNYEKNLNLVQGEYIAFADQDDVWLPEKIQSLMDGIGDRMLIYSDNLYIDSNGISMGKKFSDYRNLIEGKHLYPFEPSCGNWIAGHTMLFRRELLNKALPLSKYHFHDEWIAYIAMLNGGVRFLNSPLVLYRQHQDNVCGGLGSGKIRKKRKKSKENNWIEKINSLISVVNNDEYEFKKFLTDLKKYTANPTFANRIRRMLLRLKYLNKIYAPRKRNTFRRAFKVLKLF